MGNTLTCIGTKVVVTVDGVRIKFKDYIQAIKFINSTKTKVKAPNLPQFFKDRIDKDLCEE